MFIKKVAVVGAGTMGADIAYVVAQAGIPVVLKDVTEELLQKASTHIQELFSSRVARGRMSPEDAADRQGLIRYTTDLAPLKDVSLVIEAVTEKLSVKQAVLQEIAAVVSPLTVLASNTSALSITALSEAVSRPERVAGFHFFYPAHMMKLIEVIRGETTDEETVSTLVRFAEEIRKIPVVVKECPGFVVNRVLMAGMAEVLRFQSETGVPYGEIDQAITAHKLAPMGPFVLADALGLDVALAVSKTLTAAYGDRFRPGPQLETLVSQGHLGVKTGQGFYSYR